MKQDTASQGERETQDVTKTAVEDNSAIRGFATPKRNFDRSGCT